MSTPQNENGEIEVIGVSLLIVLETVRTMERYWSVLVKPVKPNTQALLEEDELEKAFQNCSRSLNRLSQHVDWIDQIVGRTIIAGLDLATHEQMRLALYFGRFFCIAV